MGITWIEVAIRVRAEMADMLAEALAPHAYDKVVSVERVGDPDNLDPTALLPEATVKCFFPDSVITPALRGAFFDLAARHGGGPPIFTHLAETDWAEAWKQNFRPFAVGERFWVNPAWEQNVKPPDGRIALRLEPGMAFGTGLHETTRLCLCALEQWLQPGQRVLDLGTGSGILSVAAHRLGAAAVTAVDIDAVAVEAARENIALNRLEGKIELQRGSIAAALSGPYDLIVANILMSTLLDLLQKEGLLNLAAPGGVLIFSGIILPQRAKFLREFEAAGGGFLAEVREGEWLAIIGRGL